MCFRPLGERGEKEPTLFFEIEVEDETDDLIKVSLSYPYTYAMMQSELNRLDISRGMGERGERGERGESVFYHREVLIRSPEGRNVDILTISSCDGDRGEGGGRGPPEMSPHEHLFPHRARTREERSSIGQGPPSFPGKKVVYISARVHPGEVPAQHTLQGVLDFLLDETDLRAKVLRRHFVFKLIPMLNPDGVYHGNFRMDPHGQNLNRVYTHVNDEAHKEAHKERSPSVWASKQMLDLYAGENRLALFLDLHAHSSKRGCFFFGNVMNTLAEQVCVNRN